MAQLISAPATALIDQNNQLTLSWQPFTGPDGLFDQYDHWDITTKAGINVPVTVSFPAPPLYAGAALTFGETLITSDYTMSMQARATGGGGSTDSNPWQTNSLNTLRSFPAAITPSSVAFSATTVLLGQPLTVTLNGSYSGAAQWQIFWPDNTSTGWLPLTSNVVAKQFSVPGAANVIIQTRYNYNGNQYNPPSSLLRQFTQQIFVVNQQAPNTSTTTGGLTGDLGIGGQQGFEIVDANSAVTVPNPWEVIARAVVRDTQTQELKLLIATSRFSNASSLFGTMAVDVFPVNGRPRAKDLILPPYELTATSATETVPVKIGTTTLPNLIVGKSVTTALGGVFPMTVKGQGTPQQTGIDPFIWSSIGMPPGVTMNASGVINGTPLDLGLFQVTFAVQDSSVPFSIDEITLPLLIETDLKVQVAAGQLDGNGSPIAPLGTSFGVLQVGTPVNIQMQVGNINPSATTSGGLPPYTWTAPAGALPIGLTINPTTGLISGVPCSYNSTTDFGPPPLTPKTFTVTIQVTDAINAKATQTYTVVLEPAALQFGRVDQPIVFSQQEFKLKIPFFGGHSPYTFTAGSDFQTPLQDQPYYGTPVMADGCIEIYVGQGATIPGGFPTTSTGTHTFSLTIHDSTFPINQAKTTQFTYIVENEISDVRLVPGFLSHVWGFGDTAFATPLSIAGDLAGFSLAAIDGQTIARLNLTSVAAAVGSNTVYTGTIVGGAANGQSGRTFVVSGFFKANNNGTFLCTASTSTTLTLANATGTVEPLVFALTNASNAVGPSTTYTGTITGGAANAYAGRTFLIAGFGNALNNGTFLCTASTGTTLVLNNAFGVAQAGVATATDVPAAKALAAIQLSNGVTAAIDNVIPDVEFNGPPGPTFRNTEFRVPLILQQGSSIVARISREYTTLTHNNQLVPSDIGTIDTHTRPFLVGELVGLNPRKPYFNSPDIASFNSLWLARVKNGSSLPPGLSLDANDGLIYGTLAGLATSNSIIEYVDASGIVHGTVTIFWATALSNFSLIDNLSDNILIGTPYPATSKITCPTGVIPSSASVFYGNLPGGLTIGSPVGQDILISGTANESGYFDVWFQVNSTNNQTAYLYHRFVIDYIKPLTILNSALPTISAQPYTVTMQGFGGIPPYTLWSASDGVNGPWLGGVPTTGPFVGLTIVTNPDGTGTLSGTLTSPPGSSPTDLGNITFTLQDTRGAGSAVSKPLDLVYDNRLRITTPNNGIAIVPSDATDYAFTMQGAGGVPPYTWQLTTPGSPTANLPAGITFDAINSFGATGSFSGSTSVSGYNSSFQITIKDSIAGTSSGFNNNGLPFVVQTGTPVLTVDSTGVGPIPRGESYQGTLKVVGPYTTPISWQISPTPGNPNNLLSGLSVQADLSTNGVNAILSGTYSGVPHIVSTPQIITTVARTLTLVTISNSLVLSAVANASSPAGPPAGVKTTVYTGTITGGAANAYAGQRFTITGFGTGANNGTFLCTASTATTLTLLNPSGVTEVTAAAAAMVYDLQLGDTVVIAGLATSVLNGTFRVSVATSPSFPAGATSFQYNTVSSGTIGPLADSGTATGQGYKVRVIAVDAVGQTAVSLVPLVTNTNLVITGWDTVPTSGSTTAFPLPNAIIGGSYGPIQIVALHGVAPYTWSSDPTFVFNGIALATVGGSSGQLSGSATISFDQLFNFTVTDSINNTFTLFATEFASQASGLNISTTQGQLNLNQPLSGRDYSFALAAALGTPPYTFSISPLTANQLPTGLTLSALGVISGNTTLTGFNKAITFRVTDNIGAHSDKVLTLTVTAGLALQTGVDFTDSTSTGILGYTVNGSVDSINPRPNNSFYVIATGVVSTTPSQILVSIGNSNITALVESITAGTARIKLSGTGFPDAPAGSNILSITVTDSGVTVSGTFTWVVYDDGQLRVAPGSGSIPTQLLTSS